MGNAGGIATINMEGVYSAPFLDHLKLRNFY